MNRGPSGFPAVPSPRAAPIGTRLIDSTPPATTTSAWPLITVAAAKATACCDEPHWRSIVVPGTLSGQPAASGALRPMLKVCSPTWLTQPQKTSSTTAGSMPDRSARASSTCADRSTACTPDSPPPRLPTGVRTAAQMTASRMGSTPRRRSVRDDRGAHAATMVGRPCIRPRRHWEASGMQWSPRGGETAALAVIAAGLALSVVLLDAAGRVLVGTATVVLLLVVAHDLSTRPR